MSTNDRYNGWANYATWRVNLEICDDLIESLKQDRRTFSDTSALADYLKDEVDEVLTQYGSITDGFALDYARAFVDDVDFREIAEHHDDLIVPVVEDDGEFIFEWDERDEQDRDDEE